MPEIRLQEYGCFKQKIRWKTIRKPIGKIAAEGEQKRIIVAHVFTYKIV